MSAGKSKSGEYSDSFKAKCLARIAAGEKIRVVARSEGIHASTAYNWTRGLKKKRKVSSKSHVFTDLPVASSAETHLVETAAGGKYMVIICDLTSLKQLAASL